MTGALSISVGLADDHHLVRGAIRLLIEAEPDVRVVAEASDGLGALGLVGEHRPDVLVLDLMLPGMGGLGVVRQVSQQFPETKVVMLSMHANDAYVVEALRNGAMGYVLKDAEPGELVMAIRSASNGRRYLCSALGERAIAALAEGAPVAVDRLSTLTEREVEALHLAIGGLTIAEIGERLFISPRTAEKHRARAMEKLGLRTAQDLILFGMSQGLLPGPSGPGNTQA